MSRYLLVILALVLVSSQRPTEDLPEIFPDIQIHEMLPEEFEIETTTERAVEETATESVDKNTTTTVFTELESATEETAGTTMKETGESTTGEAVGTTTESTVGTTAEPTVTQRPRPFNMWYCGIGGTTKMISKAITSPVGKESEDKVNKCCHVHDYDYDLILGINETMVDFITEPYVPCGSASEADAKFCRCLGEVDSLYVRTMVKWTFCSAVKIYSYFKF